jgi:starch synthase
MALRRFPSLLVPEDIERVWIISMELWKVASVGGLGKVVYFIAKELSKMNIKVTVIMPSHGRHLNNEFRNFLDLVNLNLRAEGDRIGLDGKYYRYSLGFEKGNLDGFEIILVKGLDYTTGIIFDEWIIYKNIEEKSSLLAKAVEILALNSLPDNLPSLVHIHDWHSVLAGVKVKQVFESRRIIIPLVFTIHLLNKRSFPWHYASLEWSGIRDESHYVWFPYKHLLKTYREIWDAFSSGFIEKFGIFESDLVISVSETYYKDEIEKFIGMDIRDKLCVLHNGTDWSVNEVKSIAKRIFGTEIREVVKKNLLENLWIIKAIPEDYTTAKIMWENRHKIGVNDDWTLRSLADGELLIFAGRMVYQKGIDVLLRAFEDVIKIFQDARLLILGIPSDDYNLLFYMIEMISKMRDNVRIILGKINEEIYKLFFYSAITLIMPSRWEPFGITSIEAMALGTPVIGSNIGGLREIIIDIRENPNGNGILVTPANEDELKNAIIASIALYKYSKTKDENYLKYVKFKLDKNFDWEKLRINSIISVEERFRWDKIIRKLLNCYNKALKNAEHRALAWG